MSYTRLLDDLIRLEQEPRGERQAERLGGLEINDQLELYRLFHREVGGFAPFSILSTKAAARRYTSAKFGPYDMRPPLPPNLGIRRSQAIHN